MLIPPHLLLRKCSACFKKSFPVQVPFTDPVELNLYANLPFTVTFTCSSHRLYFTIQLAKRSHHHSTRRNVTNALALSQVGMTTNKWNSLSSCFLGCVTISMVTLMPILSQCFSATSSHCYRKRVSIMLPTTFCLISMLILFALPNLCPRNGIASFPKECYGRS